MDLLAPSISPKLTESFGPPIFFLFRLQLRSNVVEYCQIRSHEVAKDAPT